MYCSSHLWAVPMQTLLWEILITEWGAGGWVSFPQILFGEVIIPRILPVENFKYTFCRDFLDAILGRMGWDGIGGGDMFNILRNYTGGPHYHIIKARGRERRGEEGKDKRGVAQTFGAVLCCPASHCPGNIRHNIQLSSLL